MMLPSTLWLLTFGYAAHAATLKRHVGCAIFADQIKDVINGTTVTNSSVVAPGEIISSGYWNNYTLCRVIGSTSYAGGNTVNWELWLPETSNYNGRYLAVGNSGLAGAIDTWNLILSANEGYAVAGGDSGHLLSLNGNGTTEPGQYIPFMHNEYQTRSWIQNSIATFTVPTREFTKRYYSKKPKHHYYKGCSTGGAQGFALAQYHPDLFDGIYAGCPGNWYSHLILSFLWNGLHAKGDGYLSQDALDLIGNATIDQCDGNDGVYDRLIENPLECDFNITSLQCADSTTNSSSCLTAAQVATAKAIYAGPKDPRNGTQVYPGFNFGSESSWIYQESTLYVNYSTPILQNLVFNDLTYNVSTFDFGADVDTVDSTASPKIDEITANLSAFKKNGGKMIVTQGWADPYNAATWPIEHLHQLQDYFEGDVSDFFNIFMIPGGGHCGTAPYVTQAPATYHVLERLTSWVEDGEVPEDVESSNPEDGSNRTRKLCPWPKTAVYTSGDSEDWTSYVCE
ncbi:MAG: hypothetical protein M1834_005575 [Cirrosporium novae-zelandiae]|nr:MAG: hypothetical protein M1834_005575 [Cirrosporium novae-zelandiae]